MEAANYVVMPMMGVAVLACAAAGVMAWVRRRAVAGVREPVVWGVLGVVYAAFVVMKADKVAEMIESVGRGEAKAGGLYGQRHLLQVMVIAGAGLMATLLWMALRQHLAKRWRRYQWAIVGAIVIGAFGVVRMVSLHELDALGATLMIAKGVVEVAGSAMAAWGAGRRVAEFFGERRMQMAASEGRGGQPGRRRKRRAAVRTGESIGLADVHE